MSGIVVTGDFTTHGEKEEFWQAYWYLDKLSNLCHVPRKDFWFCPGNHDADYEYAGSSFKHYKEFTREFLLSQNKEGIENEEGIYKIFSLNTCSKTSLEQYDDAYLLEAEIDQILLNKQEKEYAIILMHHQVDVVENIQLLVRLKDFPCIFLSGHQHESAPLLIEDEKNQFENGIAIYPHLPEIKAGFQVLQIEKGKINNILPYYI